MDPTLSMKKVPHDIAKEMQSEIKGATKPTKAQLLTECGIIGDTNTNVHGNAIDDLKKKLHQLQQQLQLITKSGNQ